MNIKFLIIFCCLCFEVSNVKCEELLGSIIDNTEDLISPIWEDLLIKPLQALARTPLVIIAKFAGPITSILSDIIKDVSISAKIIIRYIASRFNCTIFQPIIATLADFIITVIDLIEGFAVRFSTDVASVLNTVSSNPDSISTLNCDCVQNSGSS